MLVQCSDEQAQSRFVAQRILELREEGVGAATRWPCSSARASTPSTSSSSCSAHDIPFVKRGGFHFIETAHVKDVLAHLRVIANPRDAVSWHRILLPARRPRAEDGGGAWCASWARLSNVEEAAERLATFPRRGAFTKELGRLAALLRETGTADVPPGEKVQRVVDFYVPMLRQVHPEDFPKREKDLEHFVTIAARYRSLASMLSDMALEPPTDSVGDVLAAGGEDEGLLTLSTIHSAKGLEWHAVFVIWMVDGRFPSYHTVNDEEEIEEERRLLYVAVTRAKEHLYLSYPIDIYDRSTGMVLGKPSRFVEGLPQSLLPGLQVVDEEGDWR